MSNSYKSVCQKSCHASEIKAVNNEGDDTRYVEGYASTFDTDRENDTMSKSAFDSTISRFKEGGIQAKIPLFFQHDRDKPIGTVTEMKTDDRGLYVKARVAKGTTLADDTYTLMKDGFIDSFSVGFRYDHKNVQRNAHGGRTFKDIVLDEVSAVTIPANPHADIVQVKQHELPEEVTSAPVGVTHYNFNTFSDVTLKSLGLMNSVTCDSEGKELGMGEKLRAMSEDHKLDKLHSVIAAYESVKQDVANKEATVKSLSEKVAELTAQNELLRSESSGMKASFDAQHLETNNKMAEMAGKLEAVEKTHAAKVEAMEKSHAIGTEKMKTKFHSILDGLKVQVCSNSDKK